LSSASPRPLTEYRHILDFGCGCGRLARLFKGHPRNVSGCDIDWRQVEWVKENLDYMDVRLSSVNPPLPYADDTFDCIISISIFSHLNEKSQDLFLKELHRISEPGCHLFLTVHGKVALDRSLQENSARDMISVDDALFHKACDEFSEGKHAFILQHGHLTNLKGNQSVLNRLKKWVGKPMSQPSFASQIITDHYEYGITFIPEEYLRTHWAKWFNVVDYIPGGIGGWQDIVVLTPKKSSGRGHLFARDSKKTKTVKKHASTKELKIQNSIYKKLGVNDVNEFYANKFVWQPGPNIVENDPDTKFDIAYIKQYWIYNNVSEGARILDVGCGSGTLNLLKSKKVYLAGTDLSEKALEKALIAGYDEVVLCDSFDIPYPDKSFDYIVSLDVLGHIENEVKDAYLAEWTRLLKDDGVMLHGIEMGDVDYESLSEKEKENILIDGHVGLESFDKVEERFGKYFKEVTAENCMGPCYNWHDIQKYKTTEGNIGKERRDFLLSFNHDQIKAFNAAMLLMRNLLSVEDKLGKSGGFIFIKAGMKRL